MRWVAVLPSRTACYFCISSVCQSQFIDVRNRRFCTQSHTFAIFIYLKDGPRVHGAMLHHLPAKRFHACTLTWRGLTEPVAPATLEHF